MNVASSPLGRLRRFRAGRWVAVLSLATTSIRLHSQEDPAIAGEVEELLSNSEGDPDSVMPVQPLASAVGFARTIDETPRSISVISSELMDKIGIRDADQFFRILPGTYTVNVYGIVGAANIRNNTTDVYVRGMKRPQSNIRNVMSMWDSVEIVRGPPSPIYGNGRIGGYSNYVPKSVRGTTGKYLSRPQGSISLIAASYRRAEIQLNYAHPLELGGRPGGLQMFALLNDADSFYPDNFQRDRALQGSLTLDLTDTWRLETGFIYQSAQNAGMAGANRVTQDSVDFGTYLRGSALVNLDTDNNGRVSEQEIQNSRAFPSGGVSTVNRPLSIVFPFVPGGRPAVPGVPRALQDLLLLPEYADIAATPQGQAILNASVGGPLAYTGTSGATATQQVPIGFFLNPAEAAYEKRDWSRSAVEEFQDGEVYTGYIDIIADRDATATQKFQIFFDHQNEYKISTLPFNRRQEITIVEAKYTATGKKERLPLLNRLPDWINVEMLASANVRNTDGGSDTTSGDYDHRRDLVTGALPTDTFASFIKWGDVSFATGEPVSGSIYTNTMEYGIGTMVDLTLWDRLGLLAGARYDYAKATTNENERYNRTGPYAQSSVGATLPARESTGSDDAISTSLSVNYRTPWLGFTPYATVSRASALLSAVNQSLPYANVLSGNILGEAELTEAGFKGSAVDSKVYYSIAAYEQTRSSNVEEEGESFIRSTENRGVEAELRWIPNRNWSFVLSGTWSKVKRIQLTGSRTAWATAEYIGFEDLTDSSGNVIVPADAFLWGGNALVAIPATATDYHEYGQYPQEVYGAFVGYTSDKGWGVTWNSTYLSSVSASSEIKDLLILPSSLTHNASLFYDTRKSWRFSVNVRNVTDELYWTPNNGQAGGTLLQTGFDRNYEFTITHRF